VIGGSEEENLENWNRFRRRVPECVPVWHWGETTDLLRHYLSETHGLVGVGALVPLMREKNEKMLTDLESLCDQYGSRLHLFGANWLKAINILIGKVASIDTSKNLDGARYGHLIFIHTKTGKLQQAPAKVLGRGDLDRAGRCIESAKAIDLYCNHVGRAA
jgi:hypothetical protein